MAFYFYSLPKNQFFVLLTFFKTDLLLLALDLDDPLVNTLQLEKDRALIALKITMDLLRLVLQQAD